MYRISDELRINHAPIAIEDIPTQTVTSANSIHVVGVIICFRKEISTIVAINPLIGLIIDG